MDEQTYLPGPPSPSRELVPYPLRPRDIVLRHGNSVVLYDPSSRQLSVEAAGVCPTCRRSYWEHDSEGDNLSQDDNPIVAPGYFRMLAQSRLTSPQSSVSSSDLNTSRHRLTTPVPDNAGAISLPKRYPQSSSDIAPRSSFSVPRRSQTLPHRATVEDEVIESDVQDFAPISTSRGNVLDNPALGPSDFFSPPPEEIYATPSVSDGDDTSDDEIKGEAAEKFFGSFFEIERELGKGGKGTVLLVRNRVLGSKLGRYACKRIPVGNDEAWTNNVLKELRPLEGIQHHNLVTHYFAWSANFRPSIFSPRIPHLYILQQYCNGGTLFDYIRVHEDEEQPTKKHMRLRSSRKNSLTDRRLSLQEIATYFRDIVAGVACLHSHNLVHRDLKPQNILLHTEAGQTRALVSDFGETRGVDVTREDSATGYTGTMAYSAPETVSKSSGGKYGDFTQKSDLFSLGMVLFFMCFGTLPYTGCDGGEDATDVDAIRDEVSAWAGFQESHKGRPDLPDELYAYLHRLLSKDPAMRPSAADLEAMLEQDLTTYGQLSSPPLGASYPGSSGAPGAGARRPSSVPAPDPAYLSRDSRTFGRPGRSPMRPNSRNNRSDSVSAMAHSTAMVRAPSGQSHFSKTFDESGSDSDDDAASPATARPTSSARRQMLQLLPPPPYTFRQRIHHRLVQFEGSAMYRVGVFLLKIWSLTGPCIPAAASPWLLYPLAALAAFDLVRDDPRGVPHASTTLLVVHVLVVGIAQHFDLMCAVPK